MLYGTGKVDKEVISQCLNILFGDAFFHFRAGDVLEYFQQFVLLRVVGISLEKMHLIAACKTTSTVMDNEFDSRRLYCFIESHF